MPPDMRPVTILIDRPRTITAWEWKKLRKAVITHASADKLLRVRQLDAYGIKIHGSDNTGTDLDFLACLPDYMRETHPGLVYDFVTASTAAYLRSIGAVLLSFHAALGPARFKLRVTEPGLCQPAAEHYARITSRPVPDFEFLDLPNAPP